MDPHSIETILPLQEADDEVGLDELDPLPVVVGGSSRAGCVGQPFVSWRTVSGTGAQTAKHSSVGMVERLDLLRVIDSKQVSRRFKARSLF